MASLAEELSKLSNPTPKFQDPEDDLDEGLSNQIASLYNSTGTPDNHEEAVPSKLRRQAIPLLSDSDLKYQGQLATRKSLAQDDDDEEDDSDDDGNDDDDDERGYQDMFVKFIKNPSTGMTGSKSDEDEESEEISAEGGNSSDEEDEINLSAFTKELQLKTSVGKEEKSFEFDDDGDYGKYGGMSDDMDDSGDDDDDTGEDASDASSSEEDSGVEEDGKDENKDDVSTFSKTDLSEEMEKGKATKNQIGLWDSLLEGRIKLQKALTLVNQLPQPDTWQMFEGEGGEDFHDASHKCHLAVKTLLDNLIELQTLLLIQNPETKHVVEGQKESSSTGSAVKDSDSDEEITSESETEDKPSKTIKSKPPSVVRKYLKRKLNMEDYPEFLAKRHADFQSFRNNTIQKWNDKTRLATGKLKSKSFGAFEQSSIKQIEQIMSDKERLIKRTQLKRTAYKVIGKEENIEKDLAIEANTDTDVPDTNNTSKQDAIKTHDEEIFDDDDFYHQLLRELIERKTSDVSDPITLSRQWLEIQRLRTKVKKKVDTKASKGRKLRYDIHKKLVNFMAPVDHSTWPEESKDDLYRSLFGKRFGSMVNSSQ